MSDTWSAAEVAKEASEVIYMVRLFAEAWESMEADPSSEDNCMPCLVECASLLHAAWRTLDGYNEREPMKTHLELHEYEMEGMVPDVIPDAWPEP